MKINFYPEYDNAEFEKSAREYEEIWKEEGDKIITTIEKISGLKFKEEIINAIIYQHISWASPLSLQASIDNKHKKGSLVHELCHRLLAGNNITPETKRDDPNHTLELHKLIDLILYDVYVKLYGENFAKEEIDFEISLWEGKGISPYKLAWDWALFMSKEKRQKKFKKLLSRSTPGVGG